MSADLRAGADRGPAVDHRALVDIGAEIDEGRHQHDVLADEGSAPHDGARHRAEAGLFEFVGGPAFELGGHLVPPDRIAGAALDDFHRIEPERQKHGLLQPLVHRPVSVRAAFGHAGLAAVEQVERLFDRLADFAPGRGRDLVAIVEGGLDRRFKGLEVVLHRGESLILNGYFLHNAANSSFTAF